VPAALGIQEGAYVVLGGLFGLRRIRRWRCRC
jgi:hypothetical protein